MAGPAGVHQHGGFRHHSRRTRAADRILRRFVRSRRRRHQRCRACRSSGWALPARLPRRVRAPKPSSFREALIGSVSHELRTPLSSILGASTVLSLAPEVTGNLRLKKLASLIHQESERLNVEIQNILDASRISSNGLQTKLEWAEPADFVNAALQRCRNRLASRTVEVTLPEELVLLTYRLRSDGTRAWTDSRQCRKIFAARVCYYGAWAA